MIIKTRNAKVQTWMVNLNQNQKQKNNSDHNAAQSDKPKASKPKTLTA